MNIVDSSPETNDLIERARKGDALAASDLLSRFRDRLRKMVQLRLDRRLVGRIDASDVVQEATLEAARRLREGSEAPPMEFYLWLRQLAAQKLIDAHRHHFGAEKRDIRHEVSLYRKAMPGGVPLPQADSERHQETNGEVTAQEETSGDNWSCARSSGD